MGEKFSEHLMMKQILIEKKNKYEKKLEKINKKVEDINNQLAQLDENIKPDNKNILSGIRTLCYLADDLIPIPEDLVEKFYESWKESSEDPFVNYRLNTPLISEIKDKYLIHYEQKTSVGKHDYRPDMDGHFTFYFTDGWQLILYIDVPRYHEEDSGTITITNKEENINICYDYYEYSEKYEMIMDELEKKYTKNNFDNYKTIFRFFKNVELYFPFLSSLCYM